VGSSICGYRGHIAAEQNPQILADDWPTGEFLRPGELLQRQRCGATAINAPVPHVPSAQDAAACAAAGGTLLELFSGCGRLTAAVAAQGLRTAVPVGIILGSHFDALDSRVEEATHRWLSVTESGSCGLARAAPGGALLRRTSFVGVTL